MTADPLLTTLAAALDAWRSILTQFWPHYLAASLAALIATGVAASRASAVAGMVMWLVAIGVLAPLFNQYLSFAVVADGLNAVAMFVVLGICGASVFLWLRGSGAPQGGKR